MQRVNMFYGITTPTAEQLGAGGLYFNTAYNIIYFSPDGQTITKFNGSTPENLYSLTTDAVLHTTWNFFDELEALCSTSSNGVKTYTASSSTSSGYTEIDILYTWINYCIDNTVFGKWYYESADRAEYYTESSLVAMDRTSSRTTSKPVVVTTTVTAFITFADTDPERAGSPIDYFHSRRIVIVHKSTGTYTINISEISS